MKDSYIGKALLLPINSENKILIQDRRGFKKPDWGFFGGGIENEETPLETVIRESKEELDIDILPSELEYLGEIGIQWNTDNIPRYFFLYKTNQTNFTVLEGSGAHWMSFDEMRNTLDKRERLEEIITSISKIEL